jgi:DNA-binding PadR family transcriptional regulator
MSGGGFYNELEYLVLALIGEGLGSGYAIRKAMNRMRGGRWSSESGSVYRVLRRLHRDDLVREVRRVGAKNRERFEYELTGQGQAVLSSWLILPPTSDEFAFLVDPIRTRSYFLDRLTPADRIKVVESWIQNSKGFCLGLEKELTDASFPNPIRRMAYENLLHLAQARHNWLKEMLQVVRSEVAEAPPQSPDIVVSTL